MGIPVRTSVGAPRWKLKYEMHATLKILAPSYAMLKLPYEVYKERYLEQLEAHSVTKIHQQFESLLRTYQKYGDRLVLLCFEDVIGKGDWCHRRMFAKWWEEKTGQTVPELYLNLETGEIEEHFDTPGDHPPGPKLDEGVSLF